jgi:hypothetical protein
MPTPINLSEATKLKCAMFGCETLGAGCAITALESITSAHQGLEKISLYIPHRDECRPTGMERVEKVNPGMRWSDLDLLLVKFWETRSICPQVLFPSSPRRDGASVQEWAKYLLPEVMKKGIVDVVEISKSPF